MTKKLLFILALFLGLYCPAEAQDQPGSVEIAKSAEPTDIITSGAVDCLTTASEKLPAKEAAKFCLDLAKIEADRSKRVANEAADATKASRIPADNCCSDWRYNRGFIGAGVVIRGSTNRTRITRQRIHRVPPPRRQPRTTRRSK